MNRIWVIIAETGEYSDRNDWIAGAFTDQAVAQQMLEKRDAESRELSLALDKWWDAWRAERDRRRFRGIMDWGSELAREIQSVVGPKPDGFHCDRLYLVEVPTDQWGEFHIA